MCGHEQRRGTVSVYNSYKHVIGMDALQTHLVQLVHRLETWSLGAKAGAPAHDGGSWCRCGSDATRHRAEGSQQHRAKHHHGLPKVVMCWHLHCARGGGGRLRACRAVARVCGVDHVSTRSATHHTQRQWCDAWV